MRDYIKQQSVGEVFRNTVEIYFRHLPSIVIPFAVLQLPFLLAQQVAKANHDTALLLLSTAAGLPLAFFAYGIIVVSISEICLGSDPSVWRSFKYVFSNVSWKLAGASLLQGVIVVVGFVLLIVPGIIFLLWFVFTPEVVILEGKGGWQALSRSKALGSGFQLRTLGVVVLWTIVAALIGGIAGGITGALQTEPLVMDSIDAIIQAVFQPILLVSLVLLYYDLRVRKEAYNTTRLSEDLAR